MDESLNPRTTLDYDSSAMTLESIVRFMLFAQQHHPTEGIRVVRDIDSSTGKERPSIDYARDRVYVLMQELALSPEHAHRVISHIDTAYPPSVFDGRVPIEGIVDTVINRYFDHFVPIEAI